MEIETIKSTFQVEEMEVPVRRPRNRVNENGESERWNPAWNGRKNFKKFRMRGEPRSLRGQRVIVGLEEVPKKGLGMGREYWGGDVSEGENERETQSQMVATAETLRRESQSREGGGRSQVSSGRSQAKGGAGRGRAQRQPAAKRRRIAAEGDEERGEEDSDDDGLKFRFKRR